MIAVLLGVVRAPGRLKCWFGSHRPPAHINLTWCITYECIRPGCGQICLGHLGGRR